jgi:hypothetical protein
MFSLLLPVLFPSWRFFSSIGPSPRILLTFLSDETEIPKTWESFNSRPMRIGVLQSLRNLFCNPKWNEMLYMNTCAEHLVDEYSVMREKEIATRVLASVRRGDIASAVDAQYLVFKIDLVTREHQEIVQEAAFISRPYRLNGSSE